MRLFAVPNRQRTTRNFAAKRAAGVLLEQLGQPLAHTIRHCSFDWLHCSTKATIKHLFDRRDAHSLALGAGGEADQLLKHRANGALHLRQTAYTGYENVT